MSASPSEYENGRMEEMRRFMEKHDDKDVFKIKEVLREKLEEWKETKITIGITGDSGAGKSSFINAIRGLEDDGENKEAARTGPVEMTLEPTPYHFPGHEDKIEFWDLPGIGTPADNATPETYCGNVQFKNYDAFLILAARRFTANNKKLAEKVKSLKKPFLFVRTHIDSDLASERKKKGYDEGKTLKTIRQNCLQHLKDLIECDADVFLISNMERDKFDFNDLSKAILDVLPFRQRERLLWSFQTLSEDIVKRKVQFLRDRIWMVAAISATAAAATAQSPLPAGLPTLIDTALITKEIRFYQSQLGLSGENSDEVKLYPDLQAKLTQLLLSGASELTNKIMAYNANTSSVQESTEYGPIIGRIIAGSISFASTRYFLNTLLDELENAACSLMEEESGLDIVHITTT